jgi:hypothetical protein
LLAMHPDSSEPVGGNNCIKMDYHKKLKSWTLRFTNLETIL